MRRKFLFVQIISFNEQHRGAGGDFQVRRNLVIRELGADDQFEARDFVAQSVLDDPVRGCLSSRSRGTFSSRRAGT